MPKKIIKQFIEKRDDVFHQAEKKIYEEYRNQFNRGVENLRRSAQDERAYLENEMNSLYDRQHYLENIRNVIG